MIYDTINDVHEMYDIENDPSEMTNLFTKCMDWDLKAHFSRKQERIQKHIEATSVGKVATVNEYEKEVIERLKSLGYLQHSAEKFGL